MIGCAGGKVKGPSVGIKETTPVETETKGTIAPAENKATGSGKLFDEPVEITMMVRSHSGWPYQDDWYIKKLVEERTNVRLKVTAVPGAEFGAKLVLDIAAGEYDDLLHIIDTEPAHKYEHQGVFVNIKDELDNLPNYKRFYLENEKDVMRFMTAEGNWYNFHNTGIGETNRQGWMYREDIFENHNLAVPTTSEELYDVLKKLKELYPQSYPFIFRQHLI